MSKHPPSSDVTKSTFVNKSSAQRSNPLLPANHVTIQQAPVGPTYLSANNAGSNQPVMPCMDFLWNFITPSVTEDLNLG